MRYAREVMELMAPFPGREFRVGDIVRYIGGKDIEKRKYKSISELVRRVLRQLVDSGSVEYTPAEGNGSFGTFRWKPEAEEKRRA